MLIDSSTSDDAAVYKFSDERALVATVDVFTPIVDDPYLFGQISAANSLSDVYAMGATPLFALGFIGFPTSKLPLSVMGEILKGGVDKAAEAGIGVLGGHSVDDPEPKYGLCVIGEVHPDRIMANSGARPGDELILTKAIGTGVISQAIKKGGVDDRVVERSIQSMVTLNRAAADAMREVGANACTDVSGFGLVGHLREMMHASKTSARLLAGAVPLLPGALELAEKGVVPGGSKRNLEHFGSWITWQTDAPPALRILCADAQTSGGLLMSVASANSSAMLAALATRSVAAHVVGHVVAGENGTTTVE